VDSEDAFPEDWPIRSKVRAGSELEGRWFSNYNWIRPKTPPFDAVAFTRILGFESESVVPHFLIQNIDPSNYDHVLSGITFGWLSQNAALALEMRVGKGKLLATSYRFHEYGMAAYATQLLDSLIRYVASSQCAPIIQFRDLGRVTSRSDI
jgi:hypothetical protein